ncbi:MAG: hypothetical protein Q7R47_07070 [Candidatus Diapherotrites archaeon]|nr:hypothetical protein [Candidatus Diapherotrites archaeon]
MQDQYSVAFKKDFESAGSALGSDVSGITFKADKWTFDATGDAAPATNLKTEVYDTVVDYAWTTERTTVIIRPSIVKLPDADQQAIAQNPLFNYAFDPIKRNGSDYGTGTITPILLAKDMLSNAQGASTLTASVKQLNDPLLHSGVLVQLSNGALAWAPSRAFSFTLTQPTTSKGLLYEVLVGGAMGPSILFNTQTGKGTPQAICGIAGDTEKYLVKGSGNGSLFLPSNATIASVLLVCSGETGTISVKGFDLSGLKPAPTDPQSATIAKDAQGKSIALVGAPAPVALKDIVDGIKSEYVCVTTTTNSLTLQWNASKLGVTAAPVQPQLAK